MAIRNSTEESLVVDGPRAEWLAKCRDALESRGFAEVDANETLGQVSGRFKRPTCRGEIVLTLTPEGPDGTRINVGATANVDNVHALFRSPTRKIIDEFKAGLA